MRKHLKTIRTQAMPWQRRARYDDLRETYAKLYGDLQLVRVELNTLETEMLELGEIEEADIA